MNRWSNRFVSLGALVLLTAWLTACESSPSEETPASIHVPEARPADDATAATQPSGAPAAGTPAAGTSSAAGTSVSGTPAGPAAAKAPTAGAPASAVTGVAPGGVAISGSVVPVPAQAAQQYAEALKLMQAGRTAEAESQLKQLAGAYPALAGPEVNLGLLYLQGSHLLEAETAFKAALERNPANAVAGNELGITERKLGKFTEAEAAYQRTIAVKPDYAPAYLNLGVLYDLYLAEPQKALEQFEHYIQLAGETKQVAGWMVELRKRVGAPAPAAKKEPA